jgi:hypothetical protein
MRAGLPRQAPADGAALASAIPAFRYRLRQGTRGSQPPRSPSSRTGAPSANFSPPPCVLQVLQADIDLLNPPREYEQKKHKRKRLVQSPNSFFMDVK